MHIGYVKLSLRLLDYDIPAKFQLKFTHLSTFIESFFWMVLPLKRYQCSETMKSTVSFFSWSCLIKPPRRVESRPTYKIEKGSQFNMLMLFAFLAFQVFFQNLFNLSPLLFRYLIIIKVIFKNFHLLCHSIYQIHPYILVEVLNPYISILCQTNTFINTIH